MQPSIGGHFLDFKRINKNVNAVFPQIHLQSSSPQEAGLNNAHHIEIIEEIPEEGEQSVRGAQGRPVMHHFGEHMQKSEFIHGLIHMKDNERIAEMMRMYFSEDVHIQRRLKNSAQVQLVNQ